MENTHKLTVELTDTEVEELNEYTLTTTGPWCRLSIKISDQIGELLANIEAAKEQAELETRQAEIKTQIEELEVELTTIERKLGECKSMRIPVDMMRS